MQFELEFHVRPPIKSVRDTIATSASQHVGRCARGEKLPMSKSPMVIISGEELVGAAV